MSYSVCYQCQKMVGGYEKYCDVCLKQFPAAQHKLYYKLPIDDRILHDKYEIFLHSNAIEENDLSFENYKKERDLGNL